MRMALDQFLAPPAEHDQDGGGRDEAPGCAELSLEQERHRPVIRRSWGLYRWDQRDGLPFWV